MEINQAQGQDLKTDSTPAHLSGRLSTAARKTLPWMGTIIVFIYIFSKVPFGDVIGAFTLIKPAVFISIYALQFMAFINLDSLAHYLVFNWFNAKTGWIEVFFARGATYILSLLNYFMGQGGIGYWLARKKNVSATEAASSIFFLLFMDFFSLILFTTLGIIFLIEEIGLRHFFTTGSEGHLVRFVVIALFIMILQVIVWLSRTENPFLRKVLFRGPFLVFGKSRPEHFALILLVKGTLLLSDVFFTWLLLLSFEVDIPFMHFLTYLPLIYLISAIPITVFHLGTTQAAYLLFFKDFAPPEVLLAFSLLINFMMIATRALAGSICLRRVSKELFEKSI